MPNWCSNVVEIYHDDKEKIDAIENEYNRVEKDPKIFNVIRPIPPEQATGEGWYWWCIENWGTKWEPGIHTFDRVNDNTLKMYMDTAWGPPVAIYNYMTKEGYTIDAYYCEEGMAFCGHYSEGHDQYYEYDGMSADEMEDQLPIEMDEHFNIVQYQRDREDEEEWDDENEEDFDIIDVPDDVERTDWYPKEINPVREGLYETMTNSWPFPHKALWNGKEWFTQDSDTGEYTIKNSIDHWRGLTRLSFEMKELEADLKEMISKNL